MIARFLLSTFPGCGNLDRGFIAAGYQVVTSGDPLFGQPGLDQLRPPPDVFEGVIGGPPCLPWAATRRYSPQHEYPNLIPLFERAIRDALPAWFLMENVVGAPIPDVAGYDVQHQIIHAEELGAAQRRPRRFTFGSRNGQHIIFWPRGQRGLYHYTVIPGNHGTGRSRRAHAGAEAQPYLSTQEMQDAFGMPGSWDPKALSRWGRRVVVGQSVPVQVATHLANAIQFSVEGA